jgi:Ca2+-dependent lipid-binding protein
LSISIERIENQSNACGAPTRNSKKFGISQPLVAANHNNNHKKKMTSLQDIAEEVESLTLHLTIFEGHDLIAKDRSILGRRTTSDSYVMIVLGGKVVGTTKVLLKTLNPVWNEEFQLSCEGEEARDMLRHAHPVRLVIYDKDEFTDDDCMGVIELPLLLQAAGEEGRIQWIPVETGSKEKDPGSKKKHYYCRNAKGKLKVQLAMNYKTRVVFG